MFELGVQLAACLMLWRVVRCSSPSSAGAGGMVAVDKAPSVQVGRSECGNLQEEDRNGVGTSRDGQGSDNELGGVARGATEQGGRANWWVASKKRRRTARSRIVVKNRSNRLQRSRLEEL